MKPIVNVPNRLERDSISRLFAELDLFRDTPNVVVDFSNLAWSTPTGMLVSGSKLREWVVYRSKQGLSSYPVGISNRKSGHSYLMHFGFFKYILMAEGNEVGEAPGGNRYLPISRIGKPLFNPFDQTVQDWYEAIQGEANRLARVLCGESKSAEMFTAYSYALREILRNVFEHSKASECYVCGQRWINGKAEIAIIDEGIGISSSLREAYPDINDDASALTMAILPGVSRTVGFSEDSNYFDNSGFGLYVLSELGGAYGWFTLGSGNTKMNCQDSNISLSLTSFKGTFIGLNIHKPLDRFSQILGEIIERGEKISENNGRARASGASRLLEL